MDDNALEALVPSLMLQPLVENAIRHGIEAHKGRGEIWIRGARDGESVVLTVRDGGLGHQRPHASTNDEPRSSNGIGLGNVSSRLEHLYGAAHSFTAGRGVDGCFEVLIRLPFHTQPAPLTVDVVAE